MTTQWEKTEVSLETQPRLRGYTLWSRVFDGEHIFTLRKPGETPGAGDGGYRSISAAVKAKGFDFPSETRS